MLLLERATMKATLTRSLAVAALLGLGAAACPVAAHHSTAMFDSEKIIQLSGTVRELHWTNPHVSIFIENTGATGTPRAGLWVVELTSPSSLVRSGWTRTIIKPGDKVSADVAPLRDGTKGAALRRITLSETRQSFSYNLRVQERPNLEPVGYQK
jgi:hypothetical protein